LAPPGWHPVNPELWGWPRFSELLADPARRASLEAVFAKHDLRIGDDTGGRLSGTGAVTGSRATLEAGELVIRSTLPDEGAIGRGWEAAGRAPRGPLHRRLARPPRWTEWPAAEAIGMGQPFALEAVAPVRVDLARVYLEIVWPGGRRT
jgi:hypothetical protein